MDILKIRNDFPVLRSNPNLAYLDSAAMALKPDTVIDAVDDYYRRLGVNVHRGVYGLSYEATDLYEEARGAFPFSKEQCEDCLLYGKYKV